MLLISKILRIRKVLHVISDSVPLHGDKCSVWHLASTYICSFLQSGMPPVLLFKKTLYSKYKTNKKRIQVSFYNAR